MGLLEKAGKISDEDKKEEKPVAKSGKGRAGASRRQAEEI